MINDMSLRNVSPATQQSYLHAVRSSAAIRKLLCEAANSILTRTRQILALQSWALSGGC